MKEFYTFKFSQVSDKKLRILIIVLCFISDTVSSAYMQFFWAPNRFNTQLIDLFLKFKGFDQTMFSPADKEMIRQLMINSLGLGQLCIMVINLLAYIFFYKNKKWAINYIYYWGVTMIIMGFYEGFMLFSRNIYWAIGITLSSVLYFYVAGGSRYLKKQMMEQQNEDLPLQK